MHLTLFTIFVPTMKPAQIFRQYIWIINTLRAFGQLTLEELNKKWVEDKVTEEVLKSVKWHRKTIN